LPEGNGIKWLLRQRRRARSQRSRMGWANTRLCPWLVGSRRCLAPFCFLFLWARARKDLLLSGLGAAGGQRLAGDLCLPAPEWGPCQHFPLGCAGRESGVLHELAQAVTDTRTRRVDFVLYFITHSGIGAVHSYIRVQALFFFPLLQL